MEPVLVTARLVLRPFTPADVDGLLALDGDPELMRFLDSHVKTRAEIETDVLPLLLASQPSEAGFGRLAADARADGRFIGWFGLRPVRPDAGAMVRWRGGLVATTMAVNLRSRRVMEKAGLRYARTVHAAWDDPLEGTEQGEVEYRLRREDYEETAT
ncbi:MAG: GNAT family N-acetyltransferase [Streptosporangiaceae bacterium]